MTRVAIADGDALMSLKITDGTKIHLTFRTPAVVAEQEPVDQDMAPAPGACVCGDNDS